MSKQIKWKNYTKDELTTAIAKSSCWSDACRTLKITVCTFNFKRLQHLCRINELSTEHFNIKATFKRNKHYWSHEEIFVKKSRASRSVLRDYVLRHNVLKLKCAECNTEKTWNNKPITLEIDHVNGHSEDNRLENLRMLCPNCHSQTNTYRRKN